MRVAADEVKHKTKILADGLRDAHNFANQSSQDKKPTKGEK
jgi:hypothetical protein